MSSWVHGGRMMCDVTMVEVGDTVQPKTAHIWWEGAHRHTAANNVLWPNKQPSYGPEKPKFGPKLNHNTVDILWLNSDNKIDCYIHQLWECWLNQTQEHTRESLNCTPFLTTTGSNNHLVSFVIVLLSSILLAENSITWVTLLYPQIPN